MAMPNYPGVAARPKAFDYRTSCPIYRDEFHLETIYATSYLVRIFINKIITGEAVKPIA